VLNFGNIEDYKNGKIFPQKDKIKIESFVLNPKGKSAYPAVMHFLIFQLNFHWV